MIANLMLGPPVSRRPGILYLRSCMRYTSLERQILWLAQAAGAAGYLPHITVLYRWRPGLPLQHPLVKAAEEAGIPAQQVADRGTLSPAPLLRIVALLQRQRPALLHTYEYKTNLLGLIAARLMRSKARLVATVNGYTGADAKLNLYEAADLRVLRHYQALIAVSEAVRAYLLAYGLAADHVVTIPNACQAASVTPSQMRRTSQALGLEPSQPVITLVGRLSPEKGAQYLLQAAPQVLAAQSAARFLIVGEGPQRAELEALTRRLGLAGAVRFLGYRDDVSVLLALSSVVVVPSLREAFGLILLEAMAQARPVVATRVGGIPEVVEDGLTGRLVPPADPVALAQAILGLLQNPEAAASMGRRGQTVVAELFSPALMTQRVMSVYGRILEEPL
jgi:glycosyltransferase involved in cell wall biosynthesis